MKLYGPIRWIYIQGLFRLISPFVFALLADASSLLNLLSSHIAVSIFADVYFLKLLFTLFSILC